MASKDYKPTKLTFFPKLSAKTIAHYVPLKNQVIGRIALFIFGIMLIPVLFGFYLMYLSIANIKTYKSIRVGDCPACKTTLGFHDSVTSFNCPECKNRFVLKKNKIKSF